MRKFLTFSIVIFISVFVVSHFAVPIIANSIATSKLSAALSTEKVETNMVAMPGFMLLFGHIDSVSVTAEDGMLGDIRCSKLELYGRNVNANISALDLRDGSAVRDAEDITLTGIFTAANLQEYMQSKLGGDVENLDVVIAKDGVTATGTAKLLGRSADVSVSGIFAEDKGMLYLRITHFNIRNILFGNATIGNMFGDMLLFDLAQTPFPAQFDRVEHHDGYVVVKTSYRQREAGI